MSAQQTSCARFAESVISRNNHQTAFKFFCEVIAISIAKRPCKYSIPEIFKDVDVIESLKSISIFSLVN